MTTRQALTATVAAAVLILALLAYQNLVIWSVPYPDSPAGTCAAYGTSDNAAVCYFPPAQPTPEPTATPTAAPTDQPTPESTPAG